VTYRVVPMNAAVSNKVRETLVSPFGKLPASSSVATGYGPCRSRLKTFREGEEDRIYITYDPFAGHSGLPLPGPVFIHTEPCPEYSAEGFPPGLLAIPLLFEAFAPHSRLVSTEPAEKDNLDAQITRILRTPGVDFIHIRNAEAGCFVARIELRRQ
jgi:Protein of unknown function (DUF1203)